MVCSSFGRLNFIFKSKLPIYLKRKVYNQCVLPVILYGSETWTLNAETTQRLSQIKSNGEMHVRNNQEGQEHK